MEQVVGSGRPAGPLTLAIDIGGTRLKAGVLSPAGDMLAGPARADTPHPATPDAIYWSNWSNRSDSSSGSRSDFPAWFAADAC